MSAQASDYLENKLLDHVLGVAAYTQPTNLYVGLFTTNPADDASGTEVSGGSYARVAHNVWAAASSRASSNTGQITFPTSTGSWGTVSHFGVFDASSGGNLLFYGALNSPVAVASGRQFRIASGDLDVSFDSGGFTTYLANKLLDHVLKTASYAQPTVYVGLYTTATGDGGTGTECTGTAYAREAHSSWNAASGGVTSNNGVISFTAAGAGDWGTLTHWAILDDPSAGNMLIHAALDDPVAPASGEVVEVADTALDVTLT